MENRILSVDNLVCGYGDQVVVTAPKAHLNRGSFTWEIPPTAMSYVPQAIPVDVAAPISVYDLVSTGFTRPATHHKEAIEEALSHVQLWEKRHERIGKLSGGQQRRALFARALAQKPLCYILDEPTVNMDQESEQLLGKLLHQLVFEQKRSVIATSHVEAWVEHSHIWHIEKGVLYE